MEPEFRRFVENLETENRFSWPNNKYFGNLTKYLYDQYIDNVKTNLSTHAEKRLRNFLKMRVYQFNVVSNGMLLDEFDIKSAVKWAIERYNMINNNDVNADLKWYTRQLLLDMIFGVGGPADHNITEFTETSWFASIPMWLTMQTEIDNFLNWANTNSIEIPVINNLKVIPICDFTRKYVRMDTDILYRMCAELRWLPKVDGVQAKNDYVFANKKHFWNAVFNLKKMKRMLKGNNRNAEFD